MITTWSPPYSSAFKKSSENTSASAVARWPASSTGSSVAVFFFFNDTATTEIYTLSLHDALPISPTARRASDATVGCQSSGPACRARSEEHTSELQSHSDLVCRLLLEKKKNV